MGPLEKRTTDRLKAAGFGAPAALQAQFEGTSQNLTPRDLMDMTFRLLEALSTSVMELSREVDRLTGDSD